MAKSVRATSGRARSTSSRGGGEVPVVGGREPCPCGSGRRYKACHGRAAAREETRRVPRPFAGLPGECDWVALREIVPAATAPLTLAGEYAARHADRRVTLATVLPMALRAISRADGVLVGLQVQVPSPDPSRQVGAALAAALGTEPGKPVQVGGGDDEPRLQDIVDPNAPLNVTVHSGFDFWVEEDGEVGAEAAASLERANAAVAPTRRLESVAAAYWTRERDRAYVRWVLPHDENPLLDAFARLRAARLDGLGEATRHLGSFRAHGLLVPVWEVPADSPGEEFDDAAAAFAGRLEEALGSSSPLTADERRVRSGLLSRQLTIR
jgi:hypothetical protein